MLRSPRPDKDSNLVAFHVLTSADSPNMRTFHATTEGQNRLGLRELLERYANEKWVADHYTLEEAADIALDCFKRPARRIKTPRHR